MMIANARTPEETLPHLPSLVPSGPAGGSTSAFVQQTGVSGSTPEEDPSAVAGEEP